jgi:nitrogen fixation protein FixH
MTLKPTDARSCSPSLKGRTVLICFIAFFGVVAAVNAVMLRAATSTFGGVETGSAYQAGLAFKNEVAAVRLQDALGWRVTGKILRSEQGQARIDIAALDQRGAALSGLLLTARLAHPTDARRDHAVAMSQVTSGSFRGVTDATSGQWDLIVELWRADERLFRSKSRVMLQ